MKFPLVAIRPEPGLSATVGRAREMGLEVTGHPLSKAVPCDWQLPDSLGFDGLLVGSANVFRHGGEQLKNLQHLPVFAVGEVTAQEARAAGFVVTVEGQGGLQQILDMLDETPRHLLRLSGEAHVPLKTPRHIQLTEIITYRVQHVPIYKELSESLNTGACVLLHSAGAAEHLAQEVEQLGIARQNIKIAALGPRIANAVGTGWGKVESANQPNDAQLLALARDMCQ
ncbi:uroporphyrinogen-III synthase [Erythrobacteraceae bacterium E2-1 Yellow Sea]|nr:uroporphyrinogen-III synthase [Erythrobacteraceae bacterium E2-1 Yellow Sea]